MKILPLLLTALISASCASNPSTPPPVWDDAKRVQKEIKYARPLPDLCKVPWPETANGCWLALDEYDIKATFNTELADLNAEALRKTELGYDALQNAGAMQQQLSDFYRELYEEEKQGRFIDGLLFKGVLALGLIGVAL